MRSGAQCPVCSEGRPDESGGRLRVFAGEVVDAYLNRDDAAHGYTVAFWRGRHVAEPTDLEDDESSRFWLEVVHVARGLQRRYSPVKLNFLILGNAVPHLHAHIVPRYRDDPDAGRPPRFMMDELAWQPVPDSIYLPEVAALRALLRW
jgi:diadenosine tetraphosphate (Ap4A) HIT family hydrolase